MESADSIKERIQQIISTKGLSPSKFADIIGVQRSGISHILSGRNKPGLELLNKILINFPDISGDWLITGEGEALKNRKRTPEPQQQLFPSGNTVKKEVQVEEINVNREEDPPVYQKQDNKKRETIVQQSIIPAENNKSIEKIVIFYTDRTFREYSPDEE